MQRFSGFSWGWAVEIGFGPPSGSFSLGFAGWGLAFPRLFEVERVRRWVFAPLGLEGCVSRVPAPVFRGAPLFFERCVDGAPAVWLRLSMKGASPSATSNTTTKMNTLENTKQINPKTKPVAVDTIWVTAGKVTGIFGPAGHRLWNYGDYDPAGLPTTCFAVVESEEPYSVHLPKKKVVRAVCETREAALKYVTPDRVLVICTP